MKARGGLLAAAVTLFAACGGSPTEPLTCDYQEAGFCWARLGLSGDTITAVEVTPWGLFAATRTRGTFQRNAGGEWVRSSPRHWNGRLYAASLEYLASDPPRLLMGVGSWGQPPHADTTASAVYATTDGGATWQPSDGGLSAGWESNRYRVYGELLKADPANPCVVFLGNGHGFLRSTDCGSTWAFTGSFSYDSWIVSVTDVYFDPVLDGVVWAAGLSPHPAGWILRSADGGLTWEDTLLQCEGFQYSVPGTFGTPPDHTSVLVTSGKRINRSDGSVRDNAHCGVVHSNVGTYELGDELLAVGGYALFLTEDGGSTWTTIPFPPMVGKGISSALDTHDRFILGTRNGVWAVWPEQAASER